MAALRLLLMILAMFGGLGFLVHALWGVLIAAVVLWLVGFLVIGAGSGGRPWVTGSRSRVRKKAPGMGPFFCTGRDIGGELGSP